MRPQEAARILAESIDYARLGIEALGPYGVASETVAAARPAANAGFSRAPRPDS